MTPKTEYFETIIPADHVTSLTWVADSLVDWAGGRRVFRLDGSSSRPEVSYGYPFDAAISTSTGEFAVIYSRLGTKGILLRNGKHLREINRSYYHATAYEYPVCLFEHADRTLLVHCPDDYNKLEIEDALTGEKLTSRSSSPADFFHSRLAVSPGGQYLLSAGWVWHPWDATVFYDVDEALRHPEHLDSIDWSLPTSLNVCLAEEASAGWLSESTAIITASSEPEDPESAAEAGDERLQPNGVAIFDVPSRTLSPACVLSSPAGTVMPVGQTHVIGFYEHPRLIRLSDGFVEFTIPSISSGRQLSSILRPDHAPPPLALDPSNARFAIAQSDGIHVVQVRIAPAEGDDD